MSKIRVTVGDRVYEVELDPYQAIGSELTVLVDGVPVHVMVPEADGPESLEWIVADDRPAELVIDRDLHWIKDRRGIYRLEVRDLEAPAARPKEGESRVTAPVPGLVARVLVQPGDHVESGQTLLVLEAMKMENEIRAPRSGVVSRLNVHPGQSVTLRELLAEIT